MIKVRSTTLALIVLLAGCAVQPTRPPTKTPPAHRAPQRAPVVRAPPRPEAQVLRLPGLESVIGADARALTAEFGSPQLDVHEGDARKLQFSGASCVLDVYLYPPDKGGEPRATYVDARRASDGQDVDRAACVTALQHH